MTVFLAFVKKELLALARDVPGLLVLFLMPAAFVLVMSLAMRDALKPDAGGWCRWRAWDLDASAESAAFLAALPAEARVAAAEAPATPAAGPAGRERTAADDAPAAAAERERVARAELTAALGGGEIEAGVLVRRGFGGAVADAGRAGVFVEVVAEPGVPGARVAAFHAEAARAVALARMGLALGGGWPRDAAGNRLSVGQVSGAALVEARHVRGAGAGAAPLTAVQQCVPAWLVFAMFFVVVPVSTIFIAEKQHGTLPRLRSLRVPAWVPVAGKVAPFYLVNMAQSALMLLMGRFVVPWCGGDALALDVDWGALWLIASGASVGAVGFALAVAAVARTLEQATAGGALANILMAALGGVMVPKSVMPAALRRVAEVSPMSWGMEGFQDVFARGAGAGGVVAEAGALAAFGAAGFAVAWWRLRRDG